MGIHPVKSPVVCLHPISPYQDLKGFKANILSNRIYKIGHIINTTRRLLSH